MTKINKDLESLLNRLYESNLQVNSSDIGTVDAQASHLKLTMSTKYQRKAEYLCRPLSSFRYSLSKKNASGQEIERVQTTLHERFQAFEAHVEAETEHIKVLQHQWEGVVAEIFQLGVACLGEADISALLSVPNKDSDASLPTAEVDSTLFVPEHGSPGKGAGTKRKRVFVARPKMKNLFPDFLLHTSAHQDSVPLAPGLPSDNVQQFEKDILSLGEQHIADLQTVDENHRAWWEKKQKYLMQTFMRD